MVSYLPEIRAGMALLLAFCAMVQDLRNFKIGNRQILVGLLGAAGCMVDDGRCVCRTTDSGI